MTDSADKPTNLMISNKLNDNSQDSKNVPANIPSTDIFTSYIFSTSNRSLSKYGERLLMEVISVAQEYTIDAALGINKLNFGEKYSERFATIDIPVRSLLNEDDSTNYSKAKEAALELMKIYHTVEAPVLDEDGNHKTYSDGSPQYKFASFHLLDKVVVNEKPGVVSVKLGEDTWSQILDMGKGYTRYNLLTAKKLDNVVSIRLFQILSNTSEPLHFSLERIKGIFGMQDKYINNSNGFIKRVLIPAEDEIEEKCPFEIKHILEYGKGTGKGRPSIIGITFIKVPKTSIIKNPAAVLDPVIINTLVKTFGFDERGILSNLRLFLQAKEAGIDIFEFLHKIEGKAVQATIPQAYIIRSLQNLLQDKILNNVMPVFGAVQSASYSDKLDSAEQLSKNDTDKGIKSRLEVNTAQSYSDSGLEEI